ncbi:MAG TPA: ATP-binding protein [Acidimicrobiia bacterium]|nr:ATP-binding protein [Acidimicrobiia bacterium]
MWRPFIGIVLFLIIVSPFLAVAVVTVFRGFGGPGRYIVVGLGVLFLIGLFEFARNGFRRTWAPIGALIDATKRLGDGETGVRIPINEPGPLAAVSGSFNRMAVRLEEEDERRRRLLADLGHELRTPLTVIRGEIEAVIDGLHDPESLSNVIDEVDLMERLLEDLRVLTLAEAGRLQLHREPTDIEGVIGDVVSSFSTALDARNVTSRVVVEAGMGELDVDPYRLRQVLSNLVSNALNQMQDGGKLEISARLDEAAARIEVADSGPGISSDRLEQVFERFVKSGDSTGSGLGLSIARDLVEAHGGTIAAANRPEGGAMFTIVLPL